MLLSLFVDRSYIHSIQSRSVNLETWKGRVFFTTILINENRETKPRHHKKPIKLNSNLFTRWNLTTLRGVLVSASKSAAESGTFCVGSRSSTSLNPGFCILMYSFADEGALSTHIKKEYAMHHVWPSSGAINFTAVILTVVRKTKLINSCSKPSQHSIGIFVKETINITA